ncbi:hypothetical protein [Paraburkholderia sp. SIMBA_030]|uniref:hypothetical protein n=1 Tax=Paraburkholderia sp. SIMBA_030 TaxID=3085773 RepID=UPI00397E6B4D
MSAPTSVQARVEQFLIERCRLGFSTRDDGYVLRSFARHVHATGHRGALTVELMAAWARSNRHDSNDPRTWARRLKRLRTIVDNFPDGLPANPPRFQLRLPLSRCP